MIQPIYNLSNQYYFKRTFNSSIQNKNIENSSFKENENTNQEVKIEVKTNKNSADYFITYLQPNNLEIKKDKKHYIVHFAPDGISTLEIPFDTTK